jgi:hypothetical protein
MGTCNFHIFLCKELTSIHESALIGTMLDTATGQILRDFQGGSDAAKHLAT